MDEIMEITEKEKELILKLRKEKEYSVKSDSFVNLVNGLREKADKQIVIVKEMSVNNAVDESKGEKGYSPLRMIYDRSGSYLHSYGYKNSTKEQKKVLNNLYNEYSSKTNVIFKELLEKEYGGTLSKVSEKGKESIFYRAWDKGHSNGYREVYYCYIDNIEFVKEILD
tara:strand:- start:2201 stop:2704 length:504 start_codon:yes stop_codon:yes gene_type:complete